MRTPLIIKGTLVVVLSGFLSSLPGASPGNPGAGDRVSKLLSDAKNEAIQIKDDSAVLVALNRTEVAADMDGIVMNQVRDHVNAIVRQLAKLNAERANAEPWQQTAIDRIAPLLTDLSADTEMVIDHLNGTNGRLNFKDYRELIEAHADESAELAALISDFVDYGRTKDRLENLSGKVELPAKR